MRVAILRREPQASFSMDVYADGLVKGLKAVRPNWEFIEVSPSINPIEKGKSALFAGIWKYYERYWRYPHQLKNLDADVFHIIDHSDGHLVYSLNKFNKLNVVTCHDLINLLQPESFEGRARFPLISMTAWKYAIAGMKSAEHIISVSSYTAKDVVENLDINPQKITVVPNAVDAIFHPLSTDEITSFRQQQGINSEICLLNVGSNNSRKNVSTILKVLLLLKNQGLPVNFWKVGADFNSEQKDFIKNHSLEDNITYLGKPDDHTLVLIYSAADVLVAPSLYEGFGMTILEAMACGTPVISSNVTSLPEVAGDAAILLEPKDVQGIAKAVCRLHTDNEYRNSLITKGLARVETFTWEYTAEQMIKVYEQVLR
ncbi:MAG: glycosyltransferase family 1 protein [Nostocales cyanobacterium 94392]|nr:glycosyltransferase family 1 protein [Nostocales cyanobacterium 94392]